MAQFSGDTRKLSDVDIAVYLDDKISPSERLDRKLRVRAELSFILKKEEIVLVVLNDTYPMLGYRIIKEGKLIFSSDEKKV